GDPAALAQAAKTLMVAESGKPAWYRACSGVLFVAGQVGNFDDIAKTVQRLREPGPPSPDVETASMQVMSYALATWLLSLLGVYPDAKEMYERALGLEVRIDEPARGWLGIARFFVK